MIWWTPSGATLAVVAGKAALTYMTALIDLRLAQRRTLAQRASLLRFHPVFNKLSDHRVRVLVVDGWLRRHQLQRSGLTDSDLYAALRTRGVVDLDQVRYALYETRGGMTVVPRADGPVPPLVDAGPGAATAPPLKERP